jgi:hypothetical protein
MNGEERTMPQGLPQIQPEVIYSPLEVPYCVMLIRPGDAWQDLLHNKLAHVRWYH